MQSNKFKFTNVSIFFVSVGLLTIAVLLNSCMMMGMGTMGGMGGGMNHGNNQSNSMSDTAIVRKGVIDVNSIDLNKDGYVYQCTMDWNVISDENGKCPLCRMTLKKVANEEAVKNLKEHNFEVKE
ncbi:MAG: hypothetical protein M1480_00105 [Bacteroidetes bacterium]|nr:hypothetical protein [Bacteroidota bacterium]